MAYGDRSATGSCVALYFRCSPFNSGASSVFTNCKVTLLPEQREENIWTSNGLWSNCGSRRLFACAFGSFIRVEETFASLYAIDGMIVRLVHSGLSTILSANLLITLRACKFRLVILSYIAPLQHALLANALPVIPVRTGGLHIHLPMASIHLSPQTHISGQFSSVLLMAPAS